MSYYSVFRIFILSVFLMSKIDLAAQDLEESGPKTIVKGMAEIIKMDSLYARDIVIKRDVEMPDSLKELYVFPERIADQGIINIGRQHLADGAYLLTISDLSGNECYQKWIIIKRDSKFFTVQLPHLVNGDYYVILNFNKSKYLKQKITICK